jgi:hypothetical protein
MAMAAARGTALSCAQSLFTRVSCAWLCFAFGVQDFLFFQRKHSLLEISQKHYR